MCGAGARGDRARKPVSLFAVAFRNDSAQKDHALALAAHAASGRIMATSG
jgi:hypothetical protein